ncbi:MAG: TetR/AcrR family transcriptional regulator [Treponema sp.]|jgi:AcrR family transcriptional regulator|nr:TetR/AcrR family transcriptional regulator [Treponema sp.]
MGISERRKREKLERKSDILRCARDLVVEYGAEKVSMMDIAQKAELSKATLYLYFPSKGVLFQEICNEAAERFIEYFNSLITPNLNALKLIRLFWKAYLDLFGRSDDMIVIFSMRQYMLADFPFFPINENPEKAESGSSFVIYTMIEKLIEQGRAEGIFESSINPGVIVRTILFIFSYIVENTVKMPKSSRNIRTMQEDLKSLLQMMLRGITVEGVDRSQLMLPDLENLKS